MTKKPDLSYVPDNVRRKIEAEVEAMGRAYEEALRTALEQQPRRTTATPPDKTKKQP